MSSALAQDITSSGSPDLRLFIQVYVLDILKAAIPLAASLALLAFFWGLARFIMNAGDAKGNKEGKNLMIWGTIALFVMVSVWGILRFAYGDLGFSDRPFGIPGLPTE